MLTKNLLFGRLSSQTLPNPKWLLRTCATSVKASKSTNEILPPNLEQTSVNICVLGASTPLGKFTSFLLKQNPIIGCLQMQGDYQVKGMAEDMAHIDTSCHVVGCDEASTSKALRGAEITLILPQATYSPDTSLGDRIMNEGPRLYELSMECVRHAPNSITVVAIPPVSVTTVIVEKIFKKTNWYHPGRIIGSAAMAELKASTILAKCLCFDPERVQVPIIGGPDLDLAVPLFSRAIPVPFNLKKQISALMAEFRGVPKNCFPKILAGPDLMQSYDMAEAHVLNRMVTMIALGLCGDENACACAYVRSNAIETCRHIVSRLQFAKGGVFHNYGVPILNKFELKLFERAALEIKVREQMADEYLAYLTKGDQSKLPAFKCREMEQEEILKQAVIK